MMYVNQDGSPNVRKAVTHAVVAVVGLLIALGSFVIVGPGSRGVVIRLGEVNRTLEPGFHLKIPILEQVKGLDVRIQKYVSVAQSYSKDIQTVNTAVALNYHLNSETVATLWKEIGPDVIPTVVEPAIQESVKAATANFTAQELVELRPKVKEEISVMLSERLTGRHVIVDEFSIVNFDFSEAYEKAIEAKQVAQQQALEAKNKLEQVKFEAEQRVAQATAEAEAIRIQAQAITQQGGEDYVQLKAIEKWKGEVPQYMMGNSVPFINLK